jgi:peptidoglycan/xylan/chitin deacetylase (PgdA/CDA1 family)
VNRTMQAKDDRDSQTVDAPGCGILLSYHRIAESKFDPWGLRVSQENFAAHLAVIREFGTPVSLPDFASAYPDDKAPENAIVITFDDGYVDNFKLALPLLRSSDIPATIFVTTAYMGQDYFWWEALELVFLSPGHLPQKLQLQSDNGPLEWVLDDAANYTREQHDRDRVWCKWRGEPGTRIRMYHEVYDALWGVNHAQRLRLVNDILSWADMDPVLYSDARPMKNTEVKRLGKEELITVGAHSVNHLPLDEQAPNTQVREILESRRALEEVIELPVTTFAYPHGKFCDESVDILKKNDFLCACTTRQSEVLSSTDPMLLPRYAIKDWTTEQFREKLTEWL